ncbi:nucleotidyl transferase AbiEii/AbiGii toxin family protein [Pelagibius marinus]|uniref:nucleotidyl transferase AbiEii/AbiGii toxin family protein n=1 Tax=Pelagibius marinus TaxID=2762760 RepID=UPI001872F7A6|nr:nucleotidyl transferase AbiEii/AbiGii toxin family protein [Pelagibius marinus]
MLHDAIALLDTLTETPKWTFGGGTALAVFYEHRVSYDIDIFVSDAEAVTALSPSKNPTTKELLGEHSYQFPGHYLKLELEQGEIDFIVGGRRTDEPTQPWEFEGRTILIDTPWEAAIKKIFYRPSHFKVRDVFDLAAVIDHDGERLRSCLPDVEDKLGKLLDRIDALSSSYETLVAEDVNPTERGQKYLTKTAIEATMVFLNDWTHRTRSTG